jgi:hypothetical protein
VSSAGKTSTSSRRGPEKDEIIKSILGSYHPTRYPVAFTAVWGDLAKTGWLRKFADEITKDRSGRVEAWNIIKEKCNTTSIIQNLYVLTLPRKSEPNKRGQLNRDFKTRIKTIIERCGKLQGDIASLVYVHRICVLLDAGRDLQEELQKVQECKQHLEALRDSNKNLYWKPASRNFYRFLLADEVRRKTCDSNLEALATLIESAHAAHGEPKIVSVDTLRRLINRFLESMKAK